MREKRTPRADAGSVTGSNGLDSSETWLATRRWHDARWNATASSLGARPCKAGTIGYELPKSGGHYAIDSGSA